MFAKQKKYFFGGEVKRVAHEGMFGIICVFQVEQNEN
jgi:hypothetical protein